MPEQIELRALIERKDPRLPRFVSIPAKALAAWALDRTTTLQVTMNSHDIGRRNVKQWDASRWFLEIPEQACKRAGVDTGDPVTLVLTIADEALPAELQTLIDEDPAARRAWSRLSASQQRMLRENIAAAKRSETRAARSRRELLGRSSKSPLQ